MYTTWEVRNKSKFSSRKANIDYYLYRLKKLYNEHRKNAAKDEMTHTIGEQLYQDATSDSAFKHEILWIKIELSSMMQFFMIAGLILRE